MHKTTTRLCFMQEQKGKVTRFSQMEDESWALLHLEQHLGKQSKMHTQEQIQLPGLQNTAELILVKKALPKVYCQQVSDPPQALILNVKPDYSELSVF